MIELAFSSGLKLTAQQTTTVMYACLWHLLDGEQVADGQVWRDTPLGLYSPTLVPLRAATELDNAIWTLLQHLNTQPKELRHV